jgi:HSP20 family molecular chaperone IbpA
MELKWKWSDRFNRAQSRAAALAIAAGTIGFVLGHSFNCSAISANQGDASGASVKVHSDVQSESKDSRSSSQPTRFHELWRTMMDDPGADWLEHNFDWAPLSLERALSIPFPLEARASRLRTADNGNELRITAELPGVEAKDLDVNVTDTAITIKGDLSDSLEQDKDGQKSSSRASTRFERRVVLPCRVEADKAQATLKNGMLTITVPKNQIAQAPGKKLSIQTQ